MVGPGDIEAVVLAIGDDRGDQREIRGWVAGGSIDVVGVEELLDQVGKMEEDGRVEEDGSEGEWLAWE